MHRKQIIFPSWLNSQIDDMCDIVDCSYGDYVRLCAMVNLYATFRKIIPSYKTSVDLCKYRDEFFKKVFSSVVNPKKLKPTRDELNTYFSDVEFECRKLYEYAVNLGLNVPKDYAFKIQKEKK